jgi:hypothetical protein
LFGSEPAKLVLCAIAAVSFVAVLCLQWMLAGERLRAGSAPPLSASSRSDPAAEAQAGSGTRQVDHTAGLPGTSGAASEELKSDTDSDHAIPSPAPLAGEHASPPREARPNDNRIADRREHAAVDLQPLPEVPLPAELAGERPPLGGGGPIVAQSPADESPAQASTAAPVEPAGQGSTPSGSAPPPAPLPPPPPATAQSDAERGSLVARPPPATSSSSEAQDRAVMDELAKLRDAVRGMGDRLTTLRDEMRADLSRLEAKIEAIEPPASRAPAEPAERPRQPEPADEAPPVGPQGDRDAPPPRADAQPRERGSSSSAGDMDRGREDAAETSLPSAPLSRPNRRTTRQKFFVRRAARRRFPPNREIGPVVHDGFNAYRPRVVPLRVGRDRARPGRSLRYRLEPPRYTSFRPERRRTLETRWQDSRIRPEPLECGW